MAPDDPEGTTAVAEAEPTEAPSDEPGPAAEQEPTEEVESGAPAVEDEGTEDEPTPGDGLKDAFEAYKEAFPEQCKELVGEPEVSLSEKERELRVRETRLEGRGRRGAREQAAHTAAEAAKFYEGESLQRQVVSLLGSFHQQVQGALKQAAESGEEASNLDYRSLVQRVQQLATLAATAHKQVPVQATWHSALSRLEDTATETPLSKEEWESVERLGDRSIDEAIEAVVWVAYNAGLRGADEHVVSQKEQDLRKELGLTEKQDKLLERLQEIVPNNGARPMKRGGGGAMTLEQAEEAYSANPPRISHAEYKRIREATENQKAEA